MADIRRIGAAAGARTEFCVVTGGRIATACATVLLTLACAGQTFAAGPTATSFTPSGPIRPASGQTISGLHITSSSGPCVTLDRVTNVRITNSRIGPCGADSTGVGISAANVSEIRIDHVSFDNVASALYVLNGTNNIVFEQNYATRIRGPMPRGQMVQFNNVWGAGNKIMCNVSDGTTPGYLNGTEDHINMFMSGGTSSSPVDIAYNRIRGGGPSVSGGGIMAGDQGSQYVTIRDNTLVNSGAYGVAIAGGSNNKLLRNRVFSPRFSWNQVGSYVWSQGGGTCANNEVRGNQISWIHKDGFYNPWWDGGNCTGTTGITDNTFYYGATTALSAAIFDQPYAACSETPPPTAPTGLSAALSRTTEPADVTLTWTDNASNEVNYVIERASGTGAFSALATIAANSTNYVDAGRPAGTWNYRVRAKTADQQSDPSNTATATIAAAPPPPPTAPAAPGGLTATASATNAPANITLRWTDNANNETGYIVERADGANAFSTVATLAANTATWVDSGRPAGTWNYRVRALNGTLQSDPSNTASVTLTTPPPAALVAPTGLTASLSSGTAPANVTLRWTDNATTETAYLVERADSTLAWSTIATLGANANTHVDSARPAGTWNYRVRAQAGSTQSDPSNVANVVINTGTLVSRASGVILPRANGTYGQWTNPAYTAVDESSCNGNVDYASTRTSGARVSYQVSLASIPVGAVITSIGLHPCGANDVANGTISRLDAFYRLNGVDSALAGNLPLNGISPVNLGSVYFNGLSISRTSTSTLEIGAALRSGSAGARVSRLSVTIQYLAP